MTDTFVQHCIELYQALDDRARIHELESGEKARVFAGNYTEVFQATGLSRTYYTSTRKALIKNNAMLVLQKGGRGADTVLVLKGLPQTWDIEGWNDGAGKPLTNAPESAKLRSDVDDIQKLVGGINVASALSEFQRRVETLEAQVQELQKFVIKDSPKKITTSKTKEK